MRSLVLLILTMTLSVSVHANIDLFQAKYEFKTSLVSNLVELDQLQRSYFEIKNLYSLCKEELKRSYIPFYCFQLYELSSTEGWSDKYSSLSFLNKVNNHCMTAAEVIVQKKLENRFMSKTCIHKIKQLVRLKEYKQEATAIQ